MADNRQQQQQTTTTADNRQVSDLMNTNMCNHALEIADNTCPNNATYTLGRRGDISVTLPLLSGAKITDINETVYHPLQLCVANNMLYTGAYNRAPRNIPSSNTGNIPTSRNIVSNVANN
jgi:hypothetical protein